jgi:putative CocE/NonD family hydrolase
MVERLDGVVVEDVMIGMVDGCRLFARVWRPISDEPVPALVVGWAYGNTSGPLLANFDPHNRYLARHGYATLMLDLRGSYNSEGAPQDEYVVQELDDLIEAIAWAAAQPWCSGQVGMKGISWSGFNTLQVAARRPPHLKAILSACSVDDRYADDIHYIGGCVIGEWALPWSAIMVAHNAAPPHPWEIDGDWSDQWHSRLEAIEPLLAAWLTHQRRDEFWQHGSVCEDFSRIECPALIVGGWNDGYVSGALRMSRALPQAWTLIGPWGHRYPYEAEPGPAISAEYETRWWDRWLKGVENGAERDAKLRAYIRAPRPPAPTPLTETGRWIGVRDWPIQQPQVAIDLTASMLGSPSSDERVSFSTSQSTGIDAPEWMGWISPPGASGDQRAEDGRSLCFTTLPLEAPLDILGIPAVDLAVSTDQRVAAMAVRLCHVLPDGASRLLSVGVLNLTHRNGHAPGDVAPVTPGDLMRVRLTLRAIGQHIPAGHRLRVAVSSTYWPWVWPPPNPATLTLHLNEDNALTLPLAPNETTDVALGEPEEFGPPAVEWTTEPAHERTIDTDRASGWTTLRQTDDSSGRVIENGLEFEHKYETEYGIREGDPLSARVRTTIEDTWRRGDWHCSIHVTSSMTASATTYRHDAELVALRGSAIVFQRSFQHEHERDLA